MASVLDVAAYILQITGSVTTMKLQKLAYYSQAWSLVWDEKPLFPDSVQAWVDGPVIPALYQAHKGKFTVRPGDIAGNAHALTPGEQDVVNRVIEFYGSMTGQQLSQLSHAEAPWREARQGYGSNEIARIEIPHDRIAAYYASLNPSAEA